MKSSAINGAIATRPNAFTPLAAENADYFSRNAKDRQTPTISGSSGVSVFVAPELHEMVAKRKAEKAAKTLA